ncbi:DNA adenine methylase [Avibacterium paragallinarum]|uniref:DNA adenine methylase n=2 Tax=Avibacterium paragallinarum TaxID=728 RepID=UPI001028D87F|nr:DNA adenine methylase [Avibacterium paragallinarum]RZN55949.1 modification methylase [Avibacterium paragallinarum]
MNYIGSKNKLSKFIFDSVTSVIREDLSDIIFCDLFAGTGAIGRKFKPLVKQVISNDIELYSYILNKNYIENHSLILYEELLDELNSLDGVSGFIFEEYSENGRGNRLYFSEENGKKIDAIRLKIENWRETNYLSDSQYYFLLCSLLESADKIANTASVYGAFLKKIKRSAQKQLIIEPALFEINNNSHKVYNKDANQLINDIEGDILYLDPPYNARQYGANYHLLNTISEYKRFEPKGKTGLREYLKSNYCSRAKVESEFEFLIKSAKFKYIFLSYNNEGLMSLDRIREIMSRYGRYDCFSIDYQRFRSDASKNRSYSSDSTIEYLHLCEKF